MKNVFIIAEAGVNHNGNLELAYRLVDVAKESGADAVKFQTFKSELIASSRVERADYQKDNMPGIEESQLEMIRKLELSYEMFSELKEYCDKQEILFLSTTADIPSTNFIESLVPLFKVSASDLTNYPLLRNLALKGKPIVLSTGMGDLSEVEKAIDLIVQTRPQFSSKYPLLSLLHCTTSYPCPYDEVNLKAMLTLKEAFKLPVGYSDHTQGIEIPVSAVALGATIIEKHFTLDRNMIGPDHKASLEPGELTAMVQAIRNIEMAMGDGVKKPSPSELKNIPIARKSIVAAKAIATGEIFTEENITVKRPGTGISPMRWNELIGQTAIHGYSEDDLIDA